MSVFDRFKPRSSTAVVARERLQIVLSHERLARGQPDLIALLREEILVAVAKHVLIERDKIHISMERGENVSSLEINIEIPHSPDIAMAAGF
jgi:cell division topological specificity factor